MSQMCPYCSFDNPDEATTCAQCPAPLRGLLGYRTVLSDRYQVVSVLGCGAMGAVYLAEDKRLANHRCAIKENRPDSTVSVQVQAQSREGFLAEAHILARLDHPNLPKVSDFFVENDREYLVMDYVDGEDLNSRLQRAMQPLPEESVLQWADQVLDALTYLHSQRPQPIIHRDIKPANLRVNLRNKVKLVDFGLVKLLDHNNPETKAEMRGVGTPAYAPLEQFASNNDHTDARSDVYSLGATLYHLLTNAWPPDVHGRLFNPEILAPPSQLVPDISANTEQIILKAMAIYPNERFQSAEEMRQALLAPPPPEPEPVFAAPLPPPRPAPVFSPWVFGVVGLGMVLFILAGVSYLLFGTQSGVTAQPPAVVEGQPVPTQTPWVLQMLSDAPTDTPTLVVEPVAAEETPTVAATPATDTPTPSPTATPTPSPGAAGNGRGIPRASLVGTIAYAVFNGQDYDIYFGQADGSGSRLFRTGASQPAFSPDGSRIAFRSWSSNARSVITMDVSGPNLRVAANFAEDALPTWSADGQHLVLLSRRAGDRKSRLVKVGSFEEKADGLVIGEGEYPSIGATGQMVFRGWGSTAPGLRLATTNLENVQTVTTSEEDTAPVLSPDGQQVAFMSRRDGNWEIYVVETNGSNLQRLTNDPGQDGLPTWSPDGRVLAFVSDRSGAWGIWVMTPTGQDQRQLFPMGGSPDGFIGTDMAASRGWAEERISWTE